MDVQSLHIENGQPVPPEQRLERRQAEIKHVLVINCVELGFFDEIRGVRKFKNDAAIGFEQGAEACDKIVCVGRMCEHIVSHDQIRLPAAGGQLRAEVLGEELNERLD